MPLTQTQTDLFRQAIIDYAFPPEYFDFTSNRPDHQVNTRAVEVKIKADLICGEADRVKNGLSNVLYWGYSRMGIRRTRVSRFRENVTPARLSIAARLFQATISPSLIEIRRLEIPEYSGVSFVSKIRMFLDPDNSAVLDRQIMKIHKAQPGTVLANVHMYPTQIPITDNNSNAYEMWCHKMREISTKYFAGEVRATDIERGFFQLVQEENLPLAGAILRDA